ncbi:MAG TPA: C25 family cysteine peptidase [Thermoanaerobaculia bacterium]
MTSFANGSLFPRRTTIAAGVVLAASLLAGGSDAFGASSGGVVFSPKGGASATGVGDYVSSSAGLNTSYRYFIEVPSGASKLVVDLFDADVGHGGFPGDQWDFPHTGDNSFDTTCTYTLLNPSGTAQPLRYSAGNTLVPTGGDNAWLSLYDSSAVVTTAPAFANSTTATKAAGGTTLTINTPVGTAANDLLIAIVGDSVLGDTITAPAGWTAVSLQSQADCGAGCRLAVFYRVAGAAEGASYIFTLNAATTAAGAILRYTGVDTTNPVNASSFANGGSNATVVTPTAEALRENTRVLRLFASSANDTSTWAASTARANANRGGISVGGADATQTNGGLTGTESDTLNNAANWRGGTIAIKGPNSNVAPGNGHWAGIVDCSGAANGVADSGYGIRANDGDATSGGTEYPIYYESFQNYISNPTNVATLQAYVNYPYVTASCTAKSNNFDWDHSGATGGGDLLRLTSRTGVLVHNATGALLSESDVWVTDSFGGWTNDTDSIDYGLWKLEVTIGNFPGNGNNHITYYIGNSSSANAPPTAQPQANTYRVYLPTDGGAAPVKPYLEQQLRYSGSGGNNGPNPPANGMDSVFTVTVRVGNPTARAITFSATNLVTANVPGPAANVKYDGIAQVSQGTVTAAPALNGTGNVTWNPGTVAAGTTAILAYRVIVHPTAPNQRIVVTGTQTTNGTRATWLDETGNATQARATFTFGPLCELAATEASITPAVVAGLRAVEGPHGPVVEWSTASEIGSAGYDLYRLRLDAQGERWERVNERRVASLVGAPQGGTYRVADPSAPRAGSLRYMIVETAIDGGARRHGPFDVTLEPGGGDAPAGPHLDAAWAGRIAAARAPRRLEAIAGGEKTAGKKATLKIGVGASGLYRIDAAALAAALGTTAKEVQQKISGRAYSLSQQGQPVAWTADAGGQGILFWGQAIDSIYSAENVYWLRSDDGLAMESASAGSPSAPAGPDRTFSDTAVAERNLFAAVVVPADPDSDYWYWDFAVAGDPTDGAKSFTLDAPGFSSGGAQLAVGLHGATSVEHRALVTLNGVALGDTSWSGLTAQTATFQVPPGVLQASGNQVQVSADPQAAGSIFYIDRFATTYERSFAAAGDTLAFRGDGHSVVTVSGFSAPQVRVLDLTDPRRPRWLTNLRVDSAPGGASVTLLPSTPATPYVAVGPTAVRAPLWIRHLGRADLRSSANGADYLVVTTADLKDAAADLAALRAAEGLRTAVVDVADVMDQFNDGLSSPHALHDFLAFAHASWRPAPRYVVLAGGGNFDYRNLLGTGGNLVPPLMVETPWGLFASDNRLADGDGDGLPDVAIGRLPVVSAAELRGVVRKLQAYEAAAGAGWAGRSLLLADGTDGAIDFAADSAVLAQQLPPGWSAQSIDLGASGLAAARGDLFAALGGGVDLVTYLGHGGLDRLAAAGLLTTGDVPALSNSPRLPLVAALTCSVNRFEVPGFSSLGEELVRQPAGGGVAAWSASGLSYHAEGRALGAAFLREIAKPANLRLGDAVLAALRDEASTGVAATLDLYTFLGDPATRFKPVP